jgi:predicted phage baseplate assembly protein
VSLVVSHTNNATDHYTPVADLLSSQAFMLHFVADVDDAGRAVLRFGDGEYGQRLVDVKEVTATYRVGNGRSGNIGAESLVHIVRPEPLPPSWPAIERIRNPFPALRGEDPELIEQVRSYAPAAFRARQLRAVTELDYQNAALTIAGVSGAVASFRWTGSWYTVFVGIDPADPEMVITDIRGHTRLDDRFKQKVLDSLTRYRLAGYDLEIRSARYIPLDVSIQICVKPGYFRGDVAHAVSLALSASVQPGGRRGLFNPANFTFGQPVYLSRIYAAVEPVDGVESATVTVFHPHGRDPANELDKGNIPIGAWEIARLDNDPSNMENGTLTITAGGGS